MEVLGKMKAVQSPEFMSKETHSHMYKTRQDKTFSQSSSRNFSKTIVFHSSWDSIYIYILKCRAESSSHKEEETRSMARTLISVEGGFAKTLEKNKPTIVPKTPWGYASASRVKDRPSYTSQKETLS